MKTQDRINSIPYIVFGSTLLLLGLVGQVYQVNTLLLSLFIALLCLIVTIPKRQVFFVRLIDVWISSYIYLFLSEYLLQWQDSLMAFGMTIVSLTEGFIVASFGGTLLGYGLVAQLSSKKQNSVSLTSVQPLLIQDRSTSVETRALNKQVRHSLKMPFPKATTLSLSSLIPAEIAAFLFFLSLIVVFYIFEIITISQLLYVARSQRVYDLPISQLSNFFSAIIYTFPVIAAYHWRRYQLPSPIKLWLTLISTLAILVAFALGTRILLGFQVAGVLFFLLQGFQITKKRLLLILIIIFLLAGSQAVMRTARVTGIGSINWQQTQQELLQQPEAYLSAEGVLRVNAWIHLTKTYSPDGRVPENLFILYWWVPRQVWPDKPTMAGHWFIREMTTERGFSQTHSVSGGFSMPALLDFGPIAGAFFSMVYGFLLASLEAFVHRNRDRHHPEAILAALLFFGVFFMMRSLQTGLIFIMTASLVSVVPLMILNRLIAARQAKIPNTYKHNPYTVPIKTQGRN